jgi:hypothetical protein
MWRRRIVPLAAALIFGVVFYVGIWPFIVGAPRMKAFCSSLTPGLSVAELQSRAESKGYRVMLSPVRQGLPGLIVDRRAMGRFICEVGMKDGQLLTAKYLFND